MTQRGQAGQGELLVSDSFKMPGVFLFLTPEVLADLSLDLASHSVVYHLCVKHSVPALLLFFRLLKSLSSVLKDGARGTVAAKLNNQLPPSALRLFNVHLQFTVCSALIYLSNAMDPLQNALAKKSCLSSAFTPLVYYAMRWSALFKY